MTRAYKAHEAVNDYHKTLGWGEREVTVNASIDSVDHARRLDIADVEILKGIEYKAGYQTANQSNLWEIQRDSTLVQDGWDIEWVFQDRASEPLLEALRNANLRYRVGQ